MANEYASLSDLKSALSLQGESFADPEAMLALTAASRGIDQVTGRRFYADVDVNQVRYYSPISGAFVTIDDLVTLTSVAVDLDSDSVFETTWTVNTDFVLAPLNAAADGRPYTQLQLQPYSAKIVPVGLPRSVRVTGKFGWNAVPEVVKSATIVLAGKLMRRAREAPFGVVTGIDDVAIRIASTDPDVRFLIGPLVVLPA